MHHLIRRCCTLILLAGAFGTFACQPSAPPAAGGATAEASDPSASADEQPAAATTASPEGATETPEAAAPTEPDPAVDEPVADLAPAAAPEAGTIPPVVPPGGSVEMEPLYGQWRIDIPASIALAPERFADMDTAAMERMQFRVRFEPNGVMAMGPTMNADGLPQQPSEGTFRNAVADGNTVTFDTTSPVGEQAMSVLIEGPDNITLSLPGDEPKMVLVRIPAEP